MKNLFIILLFLVLGIGLSYAGQDTGPPDQKFQTVVLDNGYDATIPGILNFKSEAEVFRWAFSPINYTNIEISAKHQFDIGAGLQTARQNTIKHRAPRDGLRCNRETID